MGTSMAFYLIENRGLPRRTQRGMRMGNAAQRQDNIIPFPGTTMQEEIPKPQW